MNRTALLDGLVDASLLAGAAILRIVETGFEPMSKADESPVTAADHAAEAVILEALARLAPGVPVVAEEESAAGRTPEVGARFFLVDPLDGTREFVRGGFDYTVNIGLIEDGSPTLGVVYAPALGRLFAGDVASGAWTAEVEKGAGALRDRRPIRVREPGAKWTVAASKSHGNSATDRYIASIPMGERMSVGSSLKFGLLAAGEADLYPRAGPTMEWDTAAGEAVLRAAGGRCAGPDGRPLAYAKPRFFNPGFVASGPFDPPPIGAFIDETLSHREREGPAA